MRSLIALFLLATALCLGGSPSHADDAIAPTTWMSVRLDGRRIGYLLIERQRSGNTITTTQTLALAFDRNGQPLQLGNMSRSIETLDARPLGFAASTRMSAVDSTVDGRRDAHGRYRVTVTVGGQARQNVIDWPPGALLAEGQRLATLAAGRRPGTTYMLREFDPASRRVLDIQMRVLGDETVTLPEGNEILSHQRQMLDLPSGGPVYDLWLDAHGMVRKARMQVFGLPMEMLACSRTCAQAPTEDVDMLRAAMVTAPRPLTPAMRVLPLRYLLQVEDGNGQPPFIPTDEQRVTALGGGRWQVDVGYPRAGGQKPPLPQDQAANAWLQSDAPPIRRLAATIVGTAGDDRTKMHRLRSFVSDFITGHDLDVGYASALEVLDRRQGDCTEYAVLLAALARAQGIPARIVSGMAYVDRYGDAEHVFVPHEWVQAWIAGRWVSYDAALRRFDAAHLALASGDGDPWHFFSASQRVGSIRILGVTPGPDRWPPRSAIRRRGGGLGGD